MLYANTSVWTGLLCRMSMRSLVSVVAPTSSSSCARRGGEQGKPAVRTTVYFTHEEMAHLLADYREHHPIDGQSWTLLLSGPQMAWRQRVKRMVERCLSRELRNRR